MTPSISFTLAMTTHANQDGVSGEKRSPVSPGLEHVAVLSLHLSGDDLKTKSWEKIKSLRRARSSGSICDPDGTDLSVVDLPGLIQHDRTGAVDLYLTLMHIFAVLDDGTSEGHAGGERKTCEGKVYYVQASFRHARPATHHGLTGDYSVRESDLMKLFDAALPMHHEQANKLLLRCLLRLDRLPELLAHRIVEVVQRIPKFPADVEAVVYGHRFARLPHNPLLC
ncbi:hypothetical protein K466DRAFT_599139 [Polyporus arcularius HHB13444]|uniref:Uncharacterized protein n=1 Tax=Polyporus arcularius HHB13444 TaxID=1314778 RepID=A0A5C3PDM6_9APHY|nr:hypothetical protein K466DRAFT_599139 [Polyporus arcularius HHB13444]